MTVNELIAALKGCKDKKIAKVAFRTPDDKYWELESIGQFTIVPDTTVQLKPAKCSEGHDHCAGF